MGRVAELYLYKYTFRGEQGTPWDGHVIVIAGSQSTARKKALDEVKALGYDKREVNFAYKKKISTGMIVHVNEGRY